MMITPDTLVSDLLDAYPGATEVFAKYGVDVLQECPSCLCNPLELCETLCSIDDIDGLIADLQAFCAQGEAN